MHLRYEVTAQCCVLGSHSESIEWNNVSHPLDLMDNSISVGKVGSVCHTGQTGLSNHSVYLCMDLVWKYRKLKERTLRKGLVQSTTVPLECHLPWISGYLMR